MTDGDRPEAPTARVELLGANDPPPVEVVNPQGRSPFLLVGDHCGNRIPEALGTLGLQPADRERHIAWDIGIAALGEHLAQELDAVFVRQIYSRLVIDCNRDPRAPDAIPAVSDGTIIPGNQRLTPGQHASRIAAVHAPYQDAIGNEIARRRRLGMASKLVSLHSFTPSMTGTARPWQIGILHNGANDTMARAMLGWLQSARRWTVGDNQPYGMDATDHTVPRHAFAIGLDYAEIELSQAELGSRTGIRAWSAIISHALRASAGHG